MSNKFNINGSLTTTGDINIQGNLNVKGITNTVNQETLTIKDNLIAVNSDGTVLDTAGIAGVVAITGGEYYTLNSGNYTIDGQLLFELFDPQVVEGGNGAWDSMYGYYSVIAKNQENVTRFNNLWLTPTEIVEGNYGDEYDNKPHSQLYIQSGSEYPGIAVCVKLYNEVYNEYVDSAAIIAKRLSSENLGTLDANWYAGKDVTLKFENQVIWSFDDFNFVCKFIRNKDGDLLSLDDFQVKAEAYAAPVYDGEAKSLKIGRGSYEKDEKGDIKSFAFEDGQGQSIATRDDNIYDGSIAFYNEENYAFSTAKQIKILSPESDPILDISDKNHTKGIELWPGHMWLYENGNYTTFNADGISYQTSASAPHQNYNFSKDEQVSGDASTHYNYTIATREWVEPQLIKNLKDAEGEYSVKSIRPTGDNENYAYGADSLAIGKGAIATGNRAIAFGRNVKSGGNASFVIGQNNIAYSGRADNQWNAADNGYETGAANVSFVGGRNNQVKGDATFMFGVNNTETEGGNTTFIVGQANTVDKQTRSAILGTANIVGKSTQSFVVGCENTINKDGVEPVDGVIALGFVLDSANESGKTILGRLNNPVAGNTFELGDGIGIYRHNLIEGKSFIENNMFFNSIKVNAQKTVIDCEQLCIPDVGANEDWFKIENNGNNVLNVAAKAPNGMNISNENNPLTISSGSLDLCGSTNGINVKTDANHTALKINSGKTGTLEVNSNNAFITNGKLKAKVAPVETDEVVRLGDITYATATEIKDIIWGN